MPDRCHDGFRNWADQESVVDIGLMYSNPKQIEKWEHRETQIYTSHGFFYPFGGLYTTSQIHWLNYMTTTEG